MRKPVSRSHFSGLARIDGTDRIQVPTAAHPSRHPPVSISRLPPSLSHPPSSSSSPFFRTALSRSFAPSFPRSLPVTLKSFLRVSAASVHAHPSFTSISRSHSIASAVSLIISFCRSRLSPLLILLPGNHLDETGESFPPLPIHDESAALTEFNCP